MVFHALQDNVRATLDAGFSSKTIWARMQEQGRSGFCYETSLDYVNRVIKTVRSAKPGSRSGADVVAAAVRSDGSQKQRLPAKSSTEPPMTRSLHAHSAAARSTSSSPQLQLRRTGAYLQDLPARNVILEEVAVSISNRSGCVVRFSCVAGSGPALATTPAQARPDPGGGGRVRTAGANALEGRRLGYLRTHGCEHVAAACASAPAQHAKSSRTRRSSTPVSSLFPHGPVRMSCALPRWPVSTTCSKRRWISDNWSR